MKRAIRFLPWVWLMLAFSEDVQRFFGLSGSVAFLISVSGFASTWFLMGGLRGSTRALVHPIKEIERTLTADRAARNSEKDDTGRNS
jgi:hypothetical protein